MRSRPRWAAQTPVPEFFTLRQGNRPLVIVAPHGGRRRRAIRRGDSVNDLHTADIARELAERLDAHAIINHGLDRNEIDFNRITHLVIRAPQVLEMLAAAIADAGSRGDAVLVLFVHGWNMVVSCCDIGIGIRRRGDLLTGRFPTLSRERYDTDIAAIERELGRRGVLAAIGRRYTASGSDNAAQLFSGRHADHDHPVVAALGRLALAGRVDAVQLELGIPLRWPGPRRDALVNGLVSALASSPRALPPHAPRAWQIDAAQRPAEAEPLEPGFALQAVLDEEGRTAVFCGVEATSPRSMAARFCIVCTDGSMMLLVGEGEWDGRAGRYDLDGFQWRASAGDKRFAVTIDAPLVRYPTHDAYLDLEQGLAASGLVDARVSLSYEATSPESGRLRGTVMAGDMSLVVDTIAFVDRGGRGGVSPQGRIRIVVGRSLSEVTIVRSQHASQGELQMDEDEPGLGAIRVAAPAAHDGLREAEVLARVPVWRPLGEGAYSRWTFGIVRCRFEGESHARAGLFDRLEIFRRPAAVAQDLLEAGDSET